ncbi:class I SAM-dependent methyltransferase [Spongiimicrobium sp. 3-5]|uniref:class I SAM-dependent methyltransferase n=1 Tax=Spongiimicrobium sp. 3-5 TaxID=3332596 RepID=UPI0039810D4C
MKSEIIESWEKNAEEWVRVIEENQIQSRKFTNAAIVETVSKSNANKILDIGCGEGWLTRSITEMGKTAVGIDAIAPLIESARKKGQESFYQLTYEEIINGQEIPEGPYDCAVFNFCLYLKDGLIDLLVQTKKTLNENGTIIIQTLHPFFLFHQGLAYGSQWVTDSWKGLPGNFIEGHAWYARTFADWVDAFEKCDVKIIAAREVINGQGKPISLIFTIA